jgi:glutathione peroxidase
MAEQIYDIPLKSLDGKPTSLREHKGEVMLVVNVASKCGLTPQYEGLQKLYSERKGDGLVVLGFPANDFRGQEPGTNEEIADFCSTNYSIDFPMYEKITVTGPEKHPLYKALTQAQPAIEGDQAMRERLTGFGIDVGKAPELLWNFEKFVVDRKGDVVARFSPDVPADDPRLTKALDTALAAT